jgi:hypothetical protein
VRWTQPAGAWHEETWLRLVDGRPVSALTIPVLAWCCSNRQAAGQEALLLLWDTASWHRSHAVDDGIHAPNQTVKQAGHGVRIVVCPLPVKSPWLNPIEPKWVHGKRKVVEPARLLTAPELEERVCAAFDCAPEAHLAIPEHAA